MSKVVVLIPMFNHNQMTHECIKHCRENAGIPIDIVVIDDGSKEPFDSSDAKTLRLNRNSGFTKAVNEGLRALSLQFDYVVILNNDTIPQKDFLKILVEDFEADETLGIASAAIVQNREDKFLMTVEGLDLTTGEVFCFEDPELKEKRGAIFIPFTCVMFSKKLVEDIGLLDERMINHCSDNDYCLRAVMNNFGVMVDTASRVIHYQSVTVKEHWIEPSADQKTFAAKHFGVMMNEILSIIPVNKTLDKWGQMGFRYFVKEEEKPRIEVVKS